MRNKTVDIAKGLGILFVVFGHNWIVLHEKGELYRIIFSFHIPLFFFLSGVFLKETGSLPSFLKSRANSLLKPYFVVLCGLGLAQIVAGKGSLFYFVGLLYSTGSTIAWTPLWFLPYLFIVIIFSWLTVKIFTNNLLNQKIIALLPGLFLLSGVLTIPQIQLPSA
jgi:fucose 4-O-acetylase-like acetyltransferase